MNDPIVITYCFNFEDGKDETFVIRLDRETLDFTDVEVNDVPEWAELSYNKCTNCPLSETDNKYCPVALNLNHLTERFSTIFSHESVSVSVTTEDRTYKKKTTIEEALSALMGLVMVTSGCPVLDYLRPMARFHLPFASPLETSIRSLNMYILAQYLSNRNARSDSIIINLDDFENIYAEINNVNNDFSERLRVAGEKDANLSALTNLDCNATLVSYTLEDTLNEIEQYYSAYKRDL
jgi:hypothetical protein